MSDTDRLLSYAERVLEDGCTACNYSKVYCHCVMYIDGKPCCSACTH